MAAITVVCNASPLILLSAIGNLELLRLVFGEVLIAQEVYEEIVVSGAGRTGSSEVASADFLSVRKLAETRRRLEIANKYGLGVGEAATLALTEDVKASLALMDDRRGRAAAQVMAIPVAGTVGVLERAHVLGHVPDLRVAYRKLQTSSGWIAPAILNASLKQRGLPPLD